MENHCSLKVAAAPQPAGSVGLQRLGSGDSVVLDPSEAAGISGSGSGVEEESRKLPSSKFKGVVPQPNGRWGAQIYEKHQRVWLGTFNEEVEAARAYDVAVQRFRGRDAVTNFKPLLESEGSNVAAAELLFLGNHSKAEIVDMLRKHTYQDELRQSRTLYRSSSAHRPCCYGESNGVARETLFDKPVTPSDVGKLNRLVIPKQHAEKHFPLQTTGTAARKGVLLNFEDAGGKVWRFRYSYWNSSQSYVLTKGWSRFVKEKCLKAGDVVCFQRSTEPEKQQQQQLFIDWKPRPVVSTGSLFKPFLPVKPVQVVRLFGVDIVVQCGDDDDDDGLEGRKRSRELDPLATVAADLQITKKKLKHC